MYSGFQIIDAHSHFPAEKNDAEELEDYYKTMVNSEELKNLQRKKDKIKKTPDFYTATKTQKQWREAWGFSSPSALGISDSELADKWVEELDKYKINKIVWVTGGGNERLSKVINKHPDRFIGFAHHDPFSSKAVKKLKNAIEQNLKGYKIIAPIHETLISSRKLYPLWEICKKHNMPVLIHFGILNGVGVAYNKNINPAILESVAKDFPEVNFIIPHFGCGYPKELLYLGWVCENVYVDTSGSNQWMRWMPYEFNLKLAFRKFYETFGPERIIFGTDSSWFPRGFAIDYLREQFKVVRFMNIPDKEIELIFSGNIKRLLNLNEDK